MLSPPSVVYPPAIRWVLRRAFGPLSLTVSAAEPASCLELARRFGLEARIASRVRPGVLRDELGTEIAAELQVAYRGAVACGMQLRALSRWVASEAKRLGHEVVHLKLLALLESGVIVPGARPAADADLLVSRDSAEPLFAHLLSAGLVPVDTSRYEHQLAGLRHPSGALLELHTLIPGVRSEKAGPSECLETLRDRGLLVGLPGRPGFVPVPAVRAAHAIVHALAQHGNAPRSYHLLWMVADLADSGFGSEGDRALTERVAGLVSRHVPAERVRAVEELVTRLREGSDDLFDHEGSPSRVLLDHLVAASLDDGYARALRLQGGVLAPVTDLGRGRAILAAAVQAIAPSPSRMDKIYGGPGRVRGLLLKLLRPVDVVLRLLQHLASWIAWQVGRRRRFIAEALLTGPRARPSGSVR